VAVKENEIYIVSQVFSLIREKKRELLEFLKHEENRPRAVYRWNIYMIRVRRKEKNRILICFNIKIASLNW